MCMVSSIYIYIYIYIYIQIVVASAIAMCFPDKVHQTVQLYVVKCLDRSSY